LVLSHLLKTGFRKSHAAFGGRSDSISAGARDVRGSSGFTRDERR
jgi:hypothetical protein